MLKSKATIALPRHDGETPKKTFLPFVLVLIVLLHSVSLSKLSLIQDLYYIILYYIVFIDYLKCFSSHLIFLVLYMALAVLRATMSLMAHVA